MCTCGINIIILIYFENPSLTGLSWLWTLRENSADCYNSDVAVDYLATAMQCVTFRGGLNKVTNEYLMCVFGISSTKVPFTFLQGT